MRSTRGRRTSRHRRRGRCPGPGRRPGRPRPRPTRCPRRTPGRCARGRAGRRRRPPGDAAPRRHEPDDRLLDQPVHTGWARIRCANGATWSSTNPAAAIAEPMVWRAIRRARHAGRSPEPDPGPGPREPVPQLEGLTEVGLAGLGRQPDRGRELGHAELRDQRGARSGDRRPVVAAASGPRRGSTPPGAGPPRRPRGEQPGLGGVRGGPVGARLLEHRSVRRCRGWWFPDDGSILVEQVFDSRVESVDISLGKIGDPKARCRGLDASLRTCSTTEANPASRPPTTAGPRRPRRCAFPPRTSRNRDARGLDALAGAHPETTPPATPAERHAPHAPPVR